MSRNYSSSTVRYIEKLRNHTHKLLLLKETPLSEGALVLHSVKYGRIIIIITWMVHINLVPKLKIAFVQCVLEGVYFNENSIITLELDGEVYMSVERVSVGDILLTTASDSVIYPLIQRLLQACKEGKISEVDGILENWKKERYNINQPIEVTQMRCA